MVEADIEKYLPFILVRYALAHQNKKQLRHKSFLLHNASFSAT